MQGPALASALATPLAGGVTATDADAAGFAAPGGSGKAGAAAAGFAATGEAGAVACAGGCVSIAVMVGLSSLSVVTTRALRFLARYSSMQTRERCGQVCCSQSAEATFSPAGAEPVVSATGFGAGFDFVYRFWRHLGFRRSERHGRIGRRFRRRQQLNGDKRAQQDAARGRGRRSDDRMVPHRVTQKRKSRRAACPPPH